MSRLPDGNSNSHFLLRHASLRQIQIFEAVSRHLSFTRAAQELFLTQPTVSAQVKSFAEAIDLPLYEQVGRNIYLTEVGEKVAASCREIIDRLSNLEIMLDDYKGLKRGRLRVAVVTTAKYFTPKALGEFSKRHEDIDLNLKITNRENLFKRIEQNLDDLYIIGQVPRNSSDLEVVPFLPNPLVIIANHTHELAGQKVSLQRLAKEPFIMREEGSGIRSAVESVFSEQGLSINERLTMETNEAIKHCVIGDLGVACVSQLALSKEERLNGPIIELDVEGFPVQKQWNIVYPKGKELSVLANEFLEFLKGCGESYVHGY
ncbi:LysR family transcriptional regulator [Thiomicrorhabdus indica]|jgi:DNA-binding transcriptional LysR family regulator|uniref:LysR family transcriptional regulator n=1 Tax=Thiomicrorhabdus indica TaxID=2267253 RepID=UPI00102DE4AA|nr:LysR family transcriptional regulator [Thiomicrorhabdus indica]